MATTPGADEVTAVRSSAVSCEFESVVHAVSDIAIAQAATMAVRTAAGRRVNTISGQNLLGASSTGSRF